MGNDRPVQGGLENNNNNVKDNVDNKKQKTKKMLLLTKYDGPVQVGLSFFFKTQLWLNKTLQIGKKHNESYGLGLYIWGLFDESAMWWVIGSVIKLVLGSLLWLIMGDLTSVKCDQMYQGFLCV